MSWLRLDDGFATNPKIAELTDRELRVWIRMLCYCAHLQDPSVDSVTKSEVPGLNSRTFSRLIELGLLDESGGDYEVHDWEKYQPKDLTGADRQARWRARRNAKRNAPRNGERNATDRYADRDENVTLARADALARPVPVPEDQEPSFLPSSTYNEEQEGRTSTRKPTEAEIVSEQELGNGTNPLIPALPDPEGIPF